MSAADPTALIPVPPQFVNPGIDNDEILGCVVWGMYINWLLAGILVVTIVRYFTLFKKDNAIVRAVVFAVIALDAISLVNSSIMLYRWAVTHFGNYAELFTQGQTFVIYTSTNTSESFIVQTYLIYRVWLMSKNWFLVIFLEALAMVSLGGGIATSYLLATAAASLSARRSLNTVVTLWMVAGACIDLLIALALIFYLLRIKSAFQKTNNVLKRLIYMAIPTGAVTTLLAVAVFISYEIKPESQYPTGLNIWLGRIYSLSLFFNLNFRASLSEHNRNDISTRNFTKGTITQSGPDSFALNSIQVTRSTNTQHEQGARQPAPYTFTDNVSIDEEKGRFV